MSATPTPGTTPGSTPTTLVEELELAADDCFIASMIVATMGQADKADALAARAARLRERAAHAKVYERLAVVAVERAKTQDNPVQLRLAELRLDVIRALTGPIAAPKETT